jgi:hypothetical protein
MGELYSKLKNFELNRPSEEIQLGNGYIALGQ